MGVKYYFIRYGGYGKEEYTECIDVHPFRFIHDKNANQANKVFGMIRLIDWKVISLEEYELWLFLNVK